MKACILKICTVDPYIGRNHWEKCNWLLTNWTLKWQDTEVVHLTVQANTTFKIYLNPSWYLFILWLLTHLPVLERFKGWTWYSCFILFAGGLIFGSEFVSVSREAYIRGAYIRDFTLCHLINVILTKNRKLLKWVNRISMMCIKVIIRNYSLILDNQVDHFSKKSSGQNGLWNSARWQPPDSDDKWKIVKKGLQTIYGVHQVNIFVKMASENQPDGFPLIVIKNQKLLKRVDRLSTKCIKVIIWDYLLI